MHVGQAPRVEAVDRALLLLLALAAAGPSGATLAELAEAADANRSTAYRALTTLKLRGFAIQADPNGPYQLGPAAMDLADRAYTPRNLARAIHPALVALSRAADELVHLGVLVGDQVLYLDKVEPEHSIRVWSAVGQLAPVASTSMGRAILAARGVSDQQLDGYLKNLPSDRVVTRARLQEAVISARETGYAVEVGENEPGISCIGVAIMGADATVAALSITAPSSRMDPSRQRDLAELIRREVPPLLREGLALMPASSKA